MSVTLITKLQRAAAYILVLIALVAGGSNIIPPSTALAAPTTTGVSASATKTTTHKTVVKTAKKKASNLHKGSYGPNVKLLQQRLDANRSEGGDFHYNGSYSKSFGSAALAGLKKWEKANHFKVDGKVTVGSKEWKKIASTTKHTRSTKGAKLDKRCLTGGLVLCASKNAKRLYVVRSGVILGDFSARFGRSSSPTREGTFHVFRISGADAVSSVYHVSMPFAMTFSGGQAVHYSPNFHKVGYHSPGSHGCINLRDYAGARWINHKIKTGVKVVVYRK